MSLLERSSRRRSPHAVRRPAHRPGWRMRSVIFESVSKNGGHLASNLGVVELTLACLHVYDFGPYHRRPRPPALGRSATSATPINSHRPGLPVRQAPQKAPSAGFPPPTNPPTTLRRRPRGTASPPPSAWLAATARSTARTTSSRGWRRVDRQGLPSRGSTTPAHSRASCSNLLNDNG